MTARLEKSGLLQYEGISPTSGKTTTLSISMMQQESMKQSQCARNLERSGIDNYTLACIVCYTQVKIAEYKDYEYSMCVIEMEKEDDSDSYLTLPCCSRLICKTCIEGIISTVVNEGRVNIVCPHPECGESFTTDYVTSHLSDRSQLKLRYRKLLVDQNNDSKIKTCPNCSHLTEHVLPGKFRSTKDADLKITCEVCQQEWCFRCHAPWHTGKSCKEFKTGNSDFKRWSKSEHQGIPNCQKCPTCRVFIQRSSGCPHMTCDRCGTEFCYHCGGRFLELGIIDHYSPLNIWGCPRDYYPDNPCIRRCVRWGYLFAKISYLIAYPAVFILAVILFLFLLMVCIPCYCCCKICTICCYNKDMKARANRLKRYQNI